MALRITIDLTDTRVLVGIGGVAFCIIIACIICCCCYVKKKRRTRQQSVEELADAGKTRKANEYNMGVLVPVPSATAAILRNPIPDQQSRDPQCRESNLETAMKQALFNMADGFKLASHRLDIRGSLGFGHSGLVFKAQLKSKDGKRSDTVAVKTVQDDASLDDMTHFLEEALRMRSFSHEHVLTMLGIVDFDERPYVVLPYMANGDLKGYLLDHKQVFSALDLMWMALQVVEGMVYLANKKFVHRDLAARNCMVSEEGIVKVADFGLSYDLFEDDYFRADGEDKALPVKWMAPESISEKKFSEKSDVWSFGVLLWEVVTRGKVPYSGKKHHKVIEYVVEGGRLDRPDYCHPDTYDVMTKCWHQVPEERPSFVDIRLMINLLIDGTSEKREKRKSRAKRQEYGSQVL